MSKKSLRTMQGCCLLVISTVCVANYSIFGAGLLCAMGVGMVLEAQFNGKII